MLRLALIGDLHYPSLDEQSEKELYELREKFFFPFLSRFFDLTADLHISLGDLTHKGTRREFEEIYRFIRSRSANFRHVLGNHDAYALPKAEIASLIDHPMYDVLETEEALLLFLESNRELRPDDWSGYLDPEQLEWLKEQLVRSHDKPLLVFAHHPVYDTTHLSEQEKLHIVPELGLADVLAQRTGTSVYFNGHNHTHSIVTKGNWSFVQTAASICQPCYRLVEVDQGEIRVRCIPVEDSQILKGARGLFDNLPGFHAPQDTAGEESDRNQTFAIRQESRINP